MQSVSEKLGNAIKLARQERQLTQRELAERLSISPHYLMTIENKEQIPGSDLLFRIIRELNLSADAIFYLNEGFHLFGARTERGKEVLRQRAF